jgi:hypothetical protein
LSDHVDSLKFCLVLAQILDALSRSGRGASALASWSVTASVRR